jgi:hypothetical protein
MRETRQQADLVVAGASALLAGGLVCVVAAIIAFATGDVVDTGGGSFRTHVDAVWVLGALGVAMVVAAYALDRGRMR